MRPKSVKFISLLFKTKSVLSVPEIARHMGVTKQHVVDLIEEGALQAVDVSGHYHSVRVPQDFLTVVAQRLNLSPPELKCLIRDCHRSTGKPRRAWRIPVEGWRSFVARRHSFSGSEVEH